MKQLLGIQAQIQKLKSSTGDDTLGTRVKDGMIQIVSVTYQGHESEVAEISGWHPVNNFNAAIDQAMETMGYASESLTP
jgi:VCBS repeat-containing protein